MAEPTLSLRGVKVYRGLLDRAAQSALLAELRDVVARAPFFVPETPRGRRMSVRMTAAGKYGWVSDRGGYRYERLHPDGRPWPPMPRQALRTWREVTGLAREPDCCLVNYYAEKARMGLHQDRDEADFRWPVLSVSLGDEALFRVGNVARGGPTESVWLGSGDVLLMGGAARLVHHGVDRIRPGSSALLPEGGRLNLTLRVVD